MDKVEDFAFDSFWDEKGYSILDRLNFANLENGRVFSHLMSVDISKDSFEVPLFARSLILDAKYRGYTEVVIPLFNNTSFGLITKKLAGAILKSFMNVKFTERLAGIKSSKGHIYYGCPGLILDENFNPLLMLTMQVSYVEGKTITDKCICRVHQSVLSRQDELIPKTIYKKIVPLYCTKPLNFVKLNNVRQAHLKGKMVEVVLHSSPSIIVSPVLPTPEDITDDVFDRILNEELKEPVSDDHWRVL